MNEYLLYKISDTPSLYSYVFRQRRTKQYVNRPVDVAIKGKKEKVLGFISP